MHILVDFGKRKGTSQVTEQTIAEVMAAKRLSELFVSRLSFYTTEESFREMFSPYGVIRQARLVKDPRTGRNKGFGFVAYESEDEARKALKAMNGRIINNRLIFVEFANSRGKGDSADS